MLVYDEVTVSLHSSLESLARGPDALLVTKSILVLLLKALSNLALLEFPDDLITEVVSRVVHNFDGTIRMADEVLRVVYALKPFPFLVAILALDESRVHEVKKIFLPLMSLQLKVIVAEEVTRVLDGLKGESSRLTSEASDSSPFILTSFTIDAVVTFFCHADALLMIMLVDEEALLLLQLVVLEELQFSSPVVLVILA